LRAIGTVNCIHYNQKSEISKPSEPSKTIQNRSKTIH